MKLSCRKYIKKYLTMHLDGMHSLHNPGVKFLLMYDKLCLSLVLWQQILARWQQVEQTVAKARIVFQYQMSLFVFIFQELNCQISEALQSMCLKRSQSQLAVSLAQYEGKKKGKNGQRGFFQGKENADSI